MSIVRYQLPDMESPRSIKDGEMGRAWRQEQSIFGDWDFIFFF